MQYPGHFVKLGEPDSRIVKALKAQLNRMLAVQRIVALKCSIRLPAVSEVWCLQLLHWNSLRALRGCL